MSRSGYEDDYDNWQLICWRGAVESALRGRRCQHALRDMLAALDAMPSKRLIADALVTPDGECCALGALGMRRGIQMDELDSDDEDAVARAFGLAVAFVREVEYVNDEGAYLLNDEAPERRWQRVRAWVARQIREAAP